MPGRPRPPDHILIRRRPGPEVEGHQFVQRDQLHRAQGDPQPGHDQEPTGQLNYANGEWRIASSTPFAFCTLPFAFCLDFSPRQTQPHRRVHPRHQQCVIEKFRVPGQGHDADGRRADDHIGDGPEALDALLFLLADDQLDHRQDQGQPGRGRNHHGEDHADHHEAAEHEDQPGKEGGHRAQTQHPAKDVHVDPGNGQLQGREPAVRGFNRENVEKETQRIGHTGLASGKEGDAREDVRVPQRDLPGGEGALDVQLPLEVLQHQIREQVVVGDHARQHGAEGLKAVEVVEGQQGMPAPAGEEDRPKPEQGQHYQHGQGNDVAPKSFQSIHRISPNLQDINGRERRERRGTAEDKKKRSPSAKSLPPSRSA